MVRNGRRQGKTGREAGGQRGGPPPLAGQGGPMKFLLLTLVLFASVMARSAHAEDRQLDSTGQYSYAVPEGWKAIARPKGFHDVLVLPATDGKNRNIIVTNQPGTSDLE